MARRAEPVVTTGGAGLAGALFEVIDAGQQVVVDRVDLLRAEIRRDLAVLVTASGLVLVAGVIALVGYAALQAALVVWLTRQLPLEGALAVTGGMQLALGAVLILAGVRRLQRLDLDTLPSVARPQRAPDG